MVDLPQPAAPVPVLSGSAWIRARLDNLFVDHGILRGIYGHVHPVTDTVWRAAQPGPKRLDWARRQGFRTILNLRGRRDTCGSYQLEREACARLGLSLIDFPIRSRGALEKPTLLACADLFRTIERPVLMHCKSGADRVGFMSTLYLFLQEGEPLPRALRHLSWRYGHIKQAKTGVIDYFFDRFLAETDGTREAFYPWIEERYDPGQLNRDFRAQWLAAIIVDRILRRE